jgi:DNA (cytosine-5)-methyltransferase 1
MKFLSVCSGIEAASVAWRDWEAVWFSEIEPFPCAVLKHHYPEIPNLGDMTKFMEWPDADVDVLCGGTPCQSFSVAGLRKGLDDPRGNLMLTFLAIAKRYRPQWVVWENVPGVLSSNGGRDFGSFLGGLAECGYGFAYRVLDAQYFGVAQRRKRVFVVGYLGDWHPAAAVLFEQHSLQGHPAPSKQTRQRVAPTVTNGPPFSRTGNERVECDALVSHEVAPTIDASFGRLHGCSGQDANHGHGHLIFMCLNAGGQQRLDAESETLIPTIAFHPTQDPISSSDLCHAIGDNENATAAVMQTMQVRRLTPVECERLQGFPDDYTAIPWRKKPATECPDGQRYKALGNSWAVPVARWIGDRINKVSQIIDQPKK